MNRLVALLLSAFLFISFTQLTYAEMQEYPFGNKNITVNVDDSKWEIYDRYDMASLENTDGVYREIYELFLDSVDVKLIALSKNQDAFWSFAVLNIADISPEFAELSEEELQSFNFSDLSDEQIKKYAGDRSNVEGFEQTDNSVKEYNGQKYSVVEGFVTVENTRTQCQQAVTAINGFFYIFTFYPLEDVSNSTYSAFTDILSDIEYSADNSYYISSNKADDEIDEFEDRNNAALTAIITVIPVALIFGVIKIALSKRKKSNENAKNGSVDNCKVENNSINANKQNENDMSDTAEAYQAELNYKEQPDTITSNQAVYGKNQNSYATQSIPADSLRELKELYDAGVITEEEFSKKKKQLLSI